MRERGWIESKIAQGLRQAHGTIRRLKNGPVSLINARGRRLEVNGAGLAWVVVVVLEHPDVPEGIDPPVADQPNPSVVLLRREWEFLFEQLKSTRAVIRYLLRVAGEPEELGTEVMRYFQLAQADEEAAPAPSRKGSPAREPSAFRHRSSRWRPLGTMPATRISLFD